MLTLCLVFCYGTRGLHVNKSDLVTGVAEDTGLTKGDASRAVESTFSAITSALQDGSEVRVVGFGTFSRFSKSGERRAQSADWGHDKNSRVETAEV